MNQIDKIKDFFKKDTLSSNSVNKLDEILKLGVETLVGVSPIHANELIKNKIITLRDLGEITELPQIAGLPPKIFDKMVKNAAMLLDYATRPSEKKIIMLGLDNAGKTSIISLLQRKYSVIKNLLPTRGVNRQTLDFLGTSLICWDFGGQIAYRQNYYFQRPDLFLESDLMIFVIDILDTTRFDEAKEYLFKIMDIIKELGEDTPLIIAFHKYDPDVQDDQELLKMRAKLIDDIATASIEKDFKVTFVNSTIFIKETVEQLFSLAIQKLSANTDMMNLILDAYKIKIGAKSLSLMTNRNLALTSVSDDPIHDSILMQTGLIMHALSDFYKKSGLELEHNFEIKLKENNLQIVSTKLFNYNDSILYLWAIVDGNGVQFKDLDELINDIKPIVNIF